MKTSTTKVGGRASPRCLSPAETASQLGICKAKVYQMLRENALPHVRVGRRILIPTDPLEDWLNMQAGLTCKQPKEKQFLSENELARLLAAAKDERWHIGLVLLAMTGARLGEALSWRHDSLRNVEGTWVLDVKGSVKRIKNYQSSESEHSTILEVSETKTDSSRRSIPLLPEVANTLLLHMEAQKQEAAQCYGLYTPNPFLIGNELGELIDPTTFRTWFKEMVAKAEIGRNVRIHDLRGTWATNGLKAGMPLDYVASMLGHSSRNTTERYYLSLESDIEGKREALQHMESLAASVL